MTDETESHDNETVVRMPDGTEFNGRWVLQCQSNEYNAYEVITRYADQVHTIYEFDSGVHLLLKIDAHPSEVFDDELTECDTEE